MVASAYLLDKLLGAQSRYESYFRQQCRGGDEQEGLIGKWQKRQLHFRKTVRRLGIFFGREQPDINLSA